MSTKAAEQQRKQRQKEFKEKKEHEERVKAEAKKGKSKPGGEDWPGFFFVPRRYLSHSLCARPRYDWIMFWAFS